MLDFEVIVTTYNNPVALELTLHALCQQSTKVGKLCIADDGSASPTRDVIESFVQNHPEIEVRHLWQEDNGFLKNILLNKAVASSNAEYLIFIDGDCVAGPDFIARHISLASPKRFCSGSVIRLTQENTDGMNADLIESGKPFSLDWLKDHGQIDRIGTYLKTNPYGFAIGGLLESISPVKKVWNGGNSSGWRSDILAVNGFDESLRYGAEDVELGQRMKNNGVKGRHIRYTAPLLHLEHPRGYADMEQLKKNKAYVQYIKKTKCVWTNNGIVKQGEVK